MTAAAVTSLRDQTIRRIQRASSIHVVGVSGTEGAAITRLLTRLGVHWTGHDFSIDQRALKKAFLNAHYGFPTAQQEAYWQVLKKQQQHIKLGTDYLAGVGEADLIFVSQNWAAYAPNAPLAPVFAATPKKFLTITQLYFALFPGRIIAVTGSNGKSTTTRLIADIMAASGQTTWWTGNDRRNDQTLDRYDEWGSADWMVIEVSNRQLKWRLPRTPDIGVITNIVPNHLDEYGGSFAKYAAGKLSLIRRQGSTAVAVLNSDDPTLMRLSTRLASRIISYSTREKTRRGAYVDGDWLVYRDRVVERILPLDAVHLPGSHNRANVLAAIAATRAAGVAPAVIAHAIEQYRGMPGRIQLVAQASGVTWYDDTSSTTPASTQAALESFAPGTAHLIAGGHPKGVDLTPLADSIMTRHVQSVTLVASPAADALAQLLHERGVVIAVVPTLRAAVTRAHQHAKRGDHVLLSPAAAWFIHFKGKIPGDGKSYATDIERITQAGTKKPARKRAA